MGAFSCIILSSGAIPPFTSFSMATIPQINLNGTSYQALHDEYLEAHKSINKAIQAFASTTCNGRDFPSGWDDYYKARDERTEAFDKLREAQKYIEDVLVGICMQESD